MLYIFPQKAYNQNLILLESELQQQSYPSPNSELRGFACVSHKVSEISHLLELFKQIFTSPN